MIQIYYALYKAIITNTLYFVKCLHEVALMLLDLALEENTQVIEIRQPELFATASMLLLFICRLILSAGRGARHCGHL